MRSTPANHSRSAATISPLLLVSARSERSLASSRSMATSPAAGAVLEREPHEQRLDEELLLPALLEARLQLTDRGEHAEQIGGADAVAALLERGARVLGEVARLPAQVHRELRAEHVGNAGEKETVIHAAVGEPRHH